MQQRPGRRFADGSGKVLDAFFAVAETRLTFLPAFRVGFGSFSIVFGSVPSLAPLKDSERLMGTGIKPTNLGQHLVLLLIGDNSMVQHPLVCFHVVLP
jgi:hypothetical protein